MNSDEQQIPIKRMRQSLLGLNTGDCIGENTQYNHKTGKLKYSDIDIFPYTDDSDESVAICKTLLEFGCINQDDLSKRFVQRYLHSGKAHTYGAGAQRIFTQLARGKSWVTVAPAEFNGKGSMGNGSAMRIAPLGAYFAENVPQLLINAERATVITHSHPEGVAGAVAIALAASYAWLYKNKSEILIKGGANNMFDYVISHMPVSETMRYIGIAATIPKNENMQVVARTIGCGNKLTCIDSVPIAIYCAAHNLNSYKSAIIQILKSDTGDADTLCAITGGIVALSSLEPIPQEWIQKCELANIEL